MGRRGVVIGEKCGERNKEGEIWKMGCIGFGKRVEVFFIGIYYFRWGYVCYMDMMDIGYMYEYFKVIIGVFKMYWL